MVNFLNHLKDDTSLLVDLVDSDMFLLYELSGMLKELGLWDNNKIVLTHFRIPGMSLDDGLVLLMADADVIKSLIYVSGCKEIEIYIETGVSFVKLHLVGLVVNKSQSKGVGNGVVIEEIVEDNVVSSNGKDSRLFMLEWPEMGKDDEHVDISNHAPTYDVCPIVEPGNDENVKNLDCDNETAEDEHAPQPKKIDLREIRREYAGKENIKEGDFFVTQDFAHRKLIIDKLRILTVESSRVIQIVKCDNVRVNAKCFGIVVGYKKTKKAPMQFICTPTRDSDNPSTSNNKGNVGKGADISNITRRRPKWDENKHENGKRTKKPRPKATCKATNGQDQRRGGQSKNEWPRLEVGERLKG
ncbi:hypothetical protein Tco_1069528 [Tanacetum coccineum]|uniref:Uncharacterized protein n=1 Tax=Tanacetum coccineum TaxID=301880 RepID=A0ABQ5HIU2_9ASTR